MTFCLGIKGRDGLVGIADTRITTGIELITARKVSVYQGDGRALFLMTSGLRSVRDKAVTYFDDVYGQQSASCDRLFKAVNLFAQQVRRVREEDGEALEKSGLKFNIHALVGGQMSGDPEPRLFLLYPEGNWVEVGEGTPYSMIGAAHYGKPVLDRTLKYTDPMRFALKVGFLAFDSTRISAADVDYPIDVVLYEKGSFHIAQHRYEKGDLEVYSKWWQDRLRNSVNELPRDWEDAAFGKLRTAPAPMAPFPPPAQAAASQARQQQQQ